jgi:hypothetical protein
MVATDALDEVGVAHPEAKQEPLWVGPERLGPER